MELSPLAGSHLRDYGSEVCGCKQGDLRVFFRIPVRREFKQQFYPFAAECDLSSCCCRLLAVALKLQSSDIKKDGIINILQPPSPSAPAWNSLLLFSSSSSLLLFFLFSSLGVGMRGVMRRVSADLPALIRTCLFDWKAVRSAYASSEDHHGQHSGWPACV